MHLTVGTDYALRVLMYVGTHSERMCTVAEIARAHDISEPHVKKVAQSLARHGWLRTLRGKGGGIRLACEPGQIQLGEVVRALEPNFALAECLGHGSQCVLTGHCMLAEVLREALALFQARLDRSTLADVLPASPVAAGPGSMGGSMGGAMPIRPPERGKGVRPAGPADR